MRPSSGPMPNFLGLGNPIDLRNHLLAEDSTAASDAGKTMDEPLLNSIDTPPKSPTLVLPAGG